MPCEEAVSPFFIACQEGYAEVVSLLLADVRIHFNEPKEEGATPFNFACCSGQRDVVSLLLADVRIEINEPDNAQCTPLWMASQEGQLPVVQFILASGREVDTKTKSLDGHEWNNTTAAEIAFLSGIKD